MPSTFYIWENQALEKLYTNCTTRNYCRWADQAINDCSTMKNIYVYKMSCHMKSYCISILKLQGEKWISFTNRGDFHCWFYLWSLVYRLHYSELTWLMWFLSPMLTCHFIRLQYLIKAQILLHSFFSPQLIFKLFISDKISYCHPQISVTSSA